MTHFKNNENLNFLENKKLIDSNLPRILIIVIWKIVKKIAIEIKKIKSKDPNSKNV